MQLFEKTLGDFLEYWAEKTPDKEFIVYSDRNLRFTYSEFNQRVNNLAKGLMAIGVKEGFPCRYMGYKCSRLEYISFCDSQNRGGLGHGKYQLQTTRTGIFGR